MELWETYLFAPIRTLTTAHGSFDEFEIHCHQILDVDPRPGIRAFTGIERGADLLDFIPEDREIDTLRPSRPSTRAVNIRRADDGSFELGSVLSCRLLDDFVDVSMQLAVRTGRDLVQIINVGPDLGIQLANVRWGVPVSDDTRPAEVDQERRFGSLEQAGDDGFDGRFVV